VWPYAPGTTFDFPVYDGGFAAVEAEYVFRIGCDAAAGKLAWTREEAAALVGAVHLGIETAGSPLASINALGPPVIISDFGNNHGLILGPEIAGGPGRADADLACETFIDGASIGRATAAGIPGGPLESLRFLLENTAARGRPLRAGQLVSTGAVTGVHEIAIGQTCRVAFAGDGEIVCRAVRAKPLDA
jgi:2-keto-4-pentenoate hydratase